jgi:hypothetical protein
MTEQPRDWDKELANIDRAIAKQSGPPTGVPTGAPTPTPPRRRFVALAWFWTAVATILAVALVLWPYDKSCGIRLIFFLGAAVLAVVMGVLGAFTSWAHRQGLAMLLSLLVILWAGVMAAREILPRAGYAKQALEWTCPPAPPAAAPAPQAPPQ